MIAILIEVDRASVLIIEREDRQWKMHHVGIEVHIRERPSPTLAQVGKCLLRSYFLEQLEMSLWWQLMIDLESQPE